MKKLLLVASITLLSFTQKSTVYVCMSSGSVAYHSMRNCKGLTRCSHGVKDMSEAAAIKLGKRRCKMCW